ncbi:zinc-dependent metalloprotease [Kaistella jeonii]|uniref:T9SS type A sorting domain-containing protein n=1 Tax=Kaistella jeonii TaxID=266749 RepID=A0A0C1D651_9FLAO|nr:zinc-dependent metalloprotease [Kaistella jeonii]KIA89270.1 hypothetical protein OA86_06630 [Kaistella jeonii]SFC01556.1 Por secretion system C-terminal sorting domain-containing protein [Kaistella jeonii]VEI96581.1 Por secretion system C-terminal sorting domain [Kaistella jeonii]
MNKLYFVLYFFLTFLFTNAQDFCGFEQNQAHLEEIIPEIKEARLQAEAKLLGLNIQKFLRENGHGTESGKSETIYEIPIVVHLMNDGTAPLRTDAEVIKWIDDVNKFYNTTYGGEWYTVAQGNVVIPFKLVLAKRSPLCGLTTGINQINVTATYPQYSAHGLNRANEDGVSANQVRSLSRWDAQSYYNVYIVNTFDSYPITEVNGLQGFASFPTNQDATYDTFMKASVVIETTHPTTFAHEFGHSLGLEHTFKTGSNTSCPTVSSGGCETDNDRVCDTPASKSFARVTTLPGNGEPNPCDAAGYNNVQYNVMNYTDSNRLFTQGQKNRGLALFLQYRGGLTTSLGATSPSGSYPALIPAICFPNEINTQLGNYNYGPTLVKIGTIKNVSNGSLESNFNKTYYDYAALICSNTKYATNLVVNQNPQTITLACASNPNVFNVYIDYNNDGAFNENNEKVISNLELLPGVQSVETFIIPSTNVILDTPLRMRVVAGDISYTSCQSDIQNGQIEDYMVTILNEALETENINKSLKSISIFSNPARDGVFSIKFANASKELVKIAILDMSGRVVYQTTGTANNSILNVNSKLSKGNYIVKVNTGSSVTTEKLIIK